MWLLWMLACSGGKTSDREVGASKPELWPFPSAHLMADGVVSLPADLIPRSDGFGTPLPVDRLRFREGFSVVQSSVVDFGVTIDPERTSMQGRPFGALRRWMPARSWGRRHPSSSCVRLMS
jgi:hypothetical protein